MVTNPFDQFKDFDENSLDDNSIDENPFAQFANFDESVQTSVDQNKGLGGDIVTSLEKGVLGIPGMVTGLADLVPALITGDRPFDKVTDSIGEATGFKPSEWSEELNKDYSPKHNRQQAEVNDVWDDLNKSGLDVAKAYAKNPALIANQIAESTPSMLLGGAVGRAGMLAGKAIPAAEGVASKLAPEAIGYLERKFGRKAAAAIAGGVGEGVIQTGQSLDQATGEDQRKNAFAALASGAVDALIGGVVGFGAQSLGFETAETLMAKGFSKNINKELSLGKKALGKVGRIAGGAASEGLLQEFPQSAQEQMFQNYAEGNPIWDGVPRAAIEGALAGVVMGAGANVIAPQSSAGINKTQEEIDIDRRAGTILAQDEAQIQQSLQTLNNNIKSNNASLNDFDSLDQRAKELNITHAELIKKLLDENNTAQTLINNVNTNRNKQEDVATLSPEEKKILDIQNKLAEQKRIADEKELKPFYDNARATSMDNLMADMIDSQSALAEDTAIRNRQQKFNQLKEAQQNQPAEDPETRDRRLAFEKLRQQDQEDQESNQIATNLAGLEDQRRSTIEESANTLTDKNPALFGQPPIDDQEVLSAQQATENEQQIRNVLEQIKQETDPVARQQLADKLLADTGIKDAQESANVFDEQTLITDAGTPYKNKQYLEGLISEQPNNENYDIVEIDGGFIGVPKIISADQGAIKRLYEDKANAKNEISTFITEQQVPTRKQAVLPDNVQERVDENNNKINQLLQEYSLETDVITKQNLLARIEQIDGENTQLITPFGDAPQFQTQVTEQSNTKVSLPDIQSMFSQQEVIQDADGTISVKFKNGKGVTFKSIQDAGQGYIALAIATGQMSKNGKILGITVDNNVLLDAKFADDKTMWHENKHVLDNLGMITEEDNSALNREFNKLRKAGKLNFALSIAKDPITGKPNTVKRMEENRANMFAQIMTDRAAYRGKPLGKMIQKILDFFQQMLAFGKQSIAGLASEVESGKIYERQVNGETIQTTVSQAEVMAEKWYSQLENADKKFSIGREKWGGKEEVFDALSLPITDRMRSKALREGLPHFATQNDISYTIAEQVLAGVINKKTETNTPEFADWFGKSVAKTKQNEPLIFYHGTDGVFDSFNSDANSKSQHTSAGLGNFFTLKKDLAGKYGQHVMPMYLKMEKPYLMSLPEAQSFKTADMSAKRQAELKAEGYDSIIIKTGDSPYVVLFESGQAKSIHNQGEWKDQSNVYFETREINNAEKWYSTVAKSIESSNMQSAKAGRWYNQIKNYPGVKQDEMDWTGLTDFLKENPQKKITKQELQVWFEENKVQLEEVELSDAKALEHMLNNALTNTDYHYKVNNDNWTLSILDENNNIIQEQNLPQEVQDKIYSTMNEYKVQYGDSDYRTSGGKDYREFVLTWPNKKTNYHGQHFRNVKNPVVHIRTQTRTRPDGTKFLHIEELQSDWDQEGQKKGFQEISKNPWTEKSTLLAMKRMVRYAAENNLDAIAWSGGDIQNQRWGSEGFKWHANGDDTFTIFGQNQTDGKDFPIDAYATEKPIKAANANDINELIDDVMADKIIEQQYSKENYIKYRNKLSNKLWEQMQDNLLGSYFPRAEAFEEVYDKKLYKTLQKEFGKNQWGKSKFKFIEQDGLKLLSMEVTARMKSKALREGLPQFQVQEQVTEQKLPDSQYEKSFSQKNNLVQDIMQTAKIRSHDAKLLLDKLTGSISTRLANANPMLRDKMRQLDFRQSQNIIKALKVAKPLLDKTKQMSPADKHAWDLARKQSDTVKIQQIAERYGMLEHQEKLRDTLNDIRQQARDVGYDVGFIDDYWPRVIKDQEGFLQATQGLSERPEFTDALKAKAKSMGITFEELSAKFPDVRADVINSMILGHGNGIGGPGNIRSRKYEKIPPELEKYYMNSDAALMQYVYSMTKKIEARRFFGKVPPKIQAHKHAITKAQSELSRLEAQAEANQDNEEVAGIFEDRITELNDRIKLHDEALNLYKNQRDYTENIGAYISELMLTGELKKKDERVVRDILEARFNEHGTTGVVNAYKNLAYIDVMGNPLSAMTQIADLVWGAYVGKIWTPKGFSMTVQNTIDAVMKRSKMTKEDLGLERIAQEFADGTTLGNAVSKVFRTVGLTYMDSIGKEVLINNTLRQYQDQIKTTAGIDALKKKIRPTFGAETDNVIKDLATDTASDNVKMLVYSRVLDFQPVALSEMPEMYLKGGQGRIFYMLKTYTLKQMDVFRNEIVHEIKSGDPQRVKAGLGNMVALVSLLTLANAGVDELKDLVMGKEVRFKDNVIENFLTLGGASRYMRMQVTREGIGNAITQKILPPFKFINAAFADAGEKIATGDVEKGLRSVASIPVVGKLAYWHYGRGSENKKTLAEKDFAEVGKETKKFKKQFDKAEDKRAFLQANPAEFKQMKLHQNFQSSLNRNKAIINKLKKLDQTPNVVKRLGQLDNQRKLLFNSYFKSASSLTAQ